MERRVTPPPDVALGLTLGDHVVHGVVTAVGVDVVGTRPRLCAWFDAWRPDAPERGTVELRYVVPSDDVADLLRVVRPGYVGRDRSAKAIVGTRAVLHVRVGPWKVRPVFMHWTGIYDIEPHVASTRGQ